MNWNRISNKFPAFNAGAPIPDYSLLSCFYPSPTSVCFWSSNIKVGVFSGFVFGYELISAGLIAKFAVFGTRALSVKPWNSFKNISAIRAFVDLVLFDPLSSKWRRKPLINGRNSFSPSIANRVRSVINSGFGCMPSMALFRAKPRCFSPVAWDSVFGTTGRAFECWHGGIIMDFSKKSRHLIGSGTIAVAAACDRIRRETMQEDMFQPPPPTLQEVELPLDPSRLVP
jgi:hypothetical protein